VLDLAVLEAADALRAWDGRADAWFLDGFSPALNPAAWRDEVLTLVAARSAPGARAATFTVAGAVRRGLAAAGFAVDKRPGFGRKRERLEARLADAPPLDLPVPTVAVVGAGIAGASLVAALTRLGVAPRLFEGEGIGAGASGAPAGLVNPRLDAGGGPAARLHVQAVERARDLYLAAAPAAVLAEGVVQLEGQPRDAARFDRIAAWDGIAPGAMVRLTPDGVAAALDEPQGPGGLRMSQALVVQPAALVRSLLGAAAPEPVRIAAVRPTPGGRWALIDAAGATVAEADAVCLAAGWRTPELAAAAPIRPVRGQVSVAAGALPGGAAAWGGYVAPGPAGSVLFGATHDRDETGTDVRDADHARNLALLARARPHLADALAGAPLAGWAGVRGATPDHLPLAGELAPGLYCLAGLGGRGFTLAPLLAEHVAAQIAGAPNPLPRELQAAVDPLRFAAKPAP
jgi:tRNA 5-methylaminomethyl-2-thiouridine biosynthesis bifunctional protein